MTIQREINRRPPAAETKIMQIEGEFEAMLRHVAIGSVRKARSQCWVSDHVRKAAPAAASFGLPTGGRAPRPPMKEPVTDEMTATPQRSHNIQRFRRD
jgi:hypothetical protein